MIQVYHFFRLIRIVNILVIILTMSLFYALLASYGELRLYTQPEDMGGLHWMDFVGWNDSYFVWLMISVALIASAGNMINDYFDQRTDRVNKPEKVIIGKYIKRRWAIILNWTLNGIGLSIALWLSIELQNWWLVLIAFFSVNLLYFYSAIFKRKFLSGNIIVAMMTAIVPLYVFLYAYLSDFSAVPLFGNRDNIFFADNFVPLLGYCGFAFILNFIREIVKDMADVKGDLIIKSRTVPIRYGFKKTKWALLPHYLISIGILSYYVYLRLTLPNYTTNDFNQWFVILNSGVILSLLISFGILVTNNRRSYYLLSSNFIKVAILLGVISAVFYH